MFITALFLTNITRTYEMEGSYEIIKNRTGKRISCYCKGEVTLRSVDGDIFNLKSKLSQYIAIAALLGQHGDELELFCSDSSDEGKFMHFLMENPGVQ